ncbi:cytochrome C [Lacihabitans sp. CCS-44]|uniref:PQQ-dependent sugar dehydrogenase n=1 Tax=Lacihabitans sp. CCS-44 TaxID=2487331 RepID=UPI0020CC8985|nr:PQQ-dependent sugar dehydrogenase [Lacihabitans sp. CCS-44]MCP9757100.1 cytochrome C [Lacihabitans sp. CCS-44]
MSKKFLKTAFVLIFFTFGHNSFSQNPYNLAAESIQSGKELFEIQCAACHNFTQNGIGPELSQTLKKRDKNWLISYLKNPQKAMDTEPNFDKRTIAMPAFAHLKKAEVENLLAFINSKQAKPDPRKALSPDGLKNPIPEPIKKSELTLKLKYLYTAPATSDKIPLARINTMVVLNDDPKKVFLSDLRGIVYHFNEKELNPYLDFKKMVPEYIHVPGLATGLGSYAFHPEFLKNGLFYTAHSEKAKSRKADFRYADSIKVTLQWVLTEWKTNNPEAETFEGTRRELFRIDMVSQIHGMQEIAFNPNSKAGDEDYGLLYIGIGDGGASENGFPFICNSFSTPWSSVLRIDPAGNNSKNGNYGIPASNPNANNKEMAGEVFCRGFRNPNRIYWSPDGKMIISDIGHTNVEELNIGQKGLDYGWPYREGTFIIKPEANMKQVFDLKGNTKSYTWPSAQYDHDEGYAISAGYVYTANEIPALRGKYIFGDIVNGKVLFVENKDLNLGQMTNIQEFALEFDGKIDNFRNICKNNKTDLRFGQGANGEIYVYTKTDGKIYKVVGCE